MVDTAHQVGIIHFTMTDDLSSDPDFVAPAPDVACYEKVSVIEYTAPGLDVTHTAPALVIEFVPDDTHAAPAPVIKHVSVALDSRVNGDTRGLTNPQIFYIRCGGLCLTSRWFFSCRGPSKSIRNRSLRSQVVLSMRNCASLKTYYTCPSLRSRSSLRKVSRRSLSNIFLSRLRRVDQNFLLESIQHTVVQTPVAPVLQVDAFFPDVAVGDTGFDCSSTWCTGRCERCEVIRNGDRDDAGHSCR